MKRIAGYRALLLFLFLSVAVSLTFLLIRRHAAHEACERELAEFADWFKGVLHANERCSLTGDRAVHVHLASTHLLASRCDIPCNDVLFATRERVEISGSSIENEKVSSVDLESQLEKILAKHVRDEEKSCVLAIDKQLPWSTFVSIVKTATGVCRGRVALLFYVPEESNADVSVRSKVDGKILEIQTKSDLARQERRVAIAKDVLWNILSTCRSEEEPFLVASFGANWQAIGLDLMNELVRVIELCQCEIDWFSLRATLVAMYAEPLVGFVDVDFVLPEEAKDDDVVVALDSDVSWQEASGILLSMITSHRGHRVCCSISQ